MPSPMIKTSKQYIYKQYVRQAADSDSDGDESEHLFEYQYELFSLGVVIGYLEGEREILDEDEFYSQDIRRIGDMSESDDHRQTIELIHELVQMGEDITVPEEVKEDDDRSNQEYIESKAWDRVLEYADAGVMEIADDLEVQEDFDLVRIVTRADQKAWEERLETVFADYH